MNNAVFNMSVSEAIAVCKDCGVFKGECSSNEERKVIMPPITTYDEYMQYTNKLQKRGEYDILLSDDSMFQFDKGEKELMIEGRKKKYEYLRYVFIQSPSRTKTFEEYCETENTAEVEIYEELYREMYEHDTSTVSNQFPLYLRYDADLKGYKANSHSYAHLHIGLIEGYRIPVSLLITPKAFVCMVLKLAYSDLWDVNVVSKSKVRERIYASLKSQCKSNKNPFWDSIVEERDLFIG